VAQLFGVNPQAFYVSSIIVCALGFDGVDINMGCPSKSVSGRGGGAGLINSPELAGEIIAAVKKGVDDWVNGIEISKIGLKKEFTDTGEWKSERKEIPVSVKTRLGYKQIEIDRWIKELIEFEPAAITLHGRTFKQMYSGEANWEEIQKAAEIVRDSKLDIKVFGNGDVHSREEASEKINTYGVSGVLIGRAAMGNPWVFRRQTADGGQQMIEIGREERFEVMVEHCRAFEIFNPQVGFFPMRKHLAWYVKGLPDAAALRRKLVEAKSAQEVVEILEKWEEMPYNCRAV
jgi:nifR3 family TIM-barrel protein